MIGLQIETEGNKTYNMNTGANTPVTDTCFYINPYT